MPSKNHPEQRPSFIEDYVANLIGMDASNFSNADFGVIVSTQVNILENEFRRLVNTAAKRERYMYMQQAEKDKKQYAEEQQAKKANRMKELYGPRHISGRCNCPSCYAYSIYDSLFPLEEEKVSGKQFPL